MRRQDPEQIPPRGWRDIFWRVFWAISENRIFSTSGSVAFFALLAIFPGIGAIVSLYGLFADTSTMGEHIALLGGILPFTSAKPNSAIFMKVSHHLLIAFDIGYSPSTYPQ